MMSNEGGSQESTPMLVIKDNIKETEIKRLPFAEQKEQNSEYLTWTAYQ